jgi:hypothetical protein
VSVAIRSSRNNPRTHENQVLPKVHPSIARPKTVLAPLGRGLNVAYLVRVAALLPLGLCTISLRTSYATKTGALRPLDGKLAASLLL